MSAYRKFLAKNRQRQKQTQRLLQQQLEQQRLVMEITQRIRRSLNLQEILQTTVDEVRQFLRTDRVIIFQFLPEWQGIVAVESCGANWTAILSTEIYDPCFGEKYVEPFKQGLVTAKSDIHTAGIGECHLELLGNFQVRANLVVPITQGATLWGLLIAHHCQAPREWHNSEIELLQQIAAQVSIALQQAALFEQVQIELNERKQAEAALRESQIQLQRQLAEIETIYQSAPIGLNVLDTNFRFVRINQRLADINGLPIEAHIGRSVRELLPDVADAAEQLLRIVLETGSPLLNVEITGETPAQPGIQRTWLENFLPLKDGDRIIGISTVCEEITDRKQAQLALQRLNSELEQRIAERTADLTATNEQLLVALAEQQQLQQKTEDLYNNAPCGYHSLNAEGTLVRINDTELKWLGYSRDEILNKKKFVDFLMPASRQVFKDNFCQFMQQGWVSNLEFHVIARDGSTRWVSVSATAIKDEAGNFLMSRSTLFDISDRKQAEAVLQQQSLLEQLRWKTTQAIRQSLNLSAILNTAVEQMRQTLQVDRVAVYRFQPDWSGDFIAESVEEGWVKLVNSDIQPRWKDTYLQETQGGRFQQHETFVVTDIYTAGLQACHIELLEQFQAKAYAVAPVFLGTSLWGVLAIYQNATARQWQAWEMELLQQIASQLSIAIQQSELYGQLQIELQERKQTEAVLREAERRWRSLLENVQLVVVEMDLSGHINYANPCFLTLTGYTESEVLGKNWFEIFLPPARQQATRTVFSEVLHQNLHPYYRDSILTKTGEERFIAWNNTRLQDFDGNIIGTTSIGEDITERRKVEKIKDEFIGIVSHELRTPLTAIQMSLGLLKSGVYGNKPDKAQRMIEIALIDTNRLVNLVNDILDLERLESRRTVLEKAACQAMDLIQQAVDGVQTIARQQNILLAITPTDVLVWAVDDLIIQTLTNLLSNAIKFSPARSVIHLSAKHQADQVLFQVSDQGRGIPADKLESIFGRFQQVDASDAREKGGTGLGLAICRSIIERHGGKIWAESTLGQGSTFSFTLPLLPKDNL